MIPTLKDLKNTLYSVSIKGVKPTIEIGKEVIVEPTVIKETVILEPIIIEEKVVEPTIEKKQNVWNVFNKILNLK